MRKRRPAFIILIIMASLSVVTGASWSQEKAFQPQRIEARALNRIIENQEPVLLINVSSYLECMDARIPGSVCMTCDQGKDLQELFPAGKETKLVFYSGYVPFDPVCPLMDEAVRRGFTRIYILKGGLPAWKRAGYDAEAVTRIPRKVSASVKLADLGAWLKQAKNPLVLDIRSPERFKQSHLEGALNIPLSVLHLRYQDIPLDRALLVVDDEGSRSFLAASYLSRKGFENVGRLVGGMDAEHASDKRGKIK